MPENNEAFSNPLAPSNFKHGHAPSGQGSAVALTNADFRKLLMTPRVDAPAVAPPSANKEKIGGSSHSKASQQASTRSHEYNEDDDPEARRRKKKRYYAKLKKMEEEREKDLASRYRDRARERRDGENPDYQVTDTLSTTANYRAVGPTAEASNTAAERRRMVIQESKFLGGDMEHTHLVKGLDYALLQKVRSEIEVNEGEEMDPVKKMKSKQKGDGDSGDEEEDMDFKTRIGQRVYKTLFRSKPQEKNELFQAGRMAFVFDLEDEYAESDIPTTLIRSKADCPGIETQATLTTNDIVINKLTQILLYLRQGMRGKKIKKKDKGKDRDKNGKEDKKIHHPAANISIFGDVGEYDPAETTRGLGREKDKKKERDKRRSKPTGSYFERPEAGDKEEVFNKKDVSAAEYAKAVTQKFRKVEDEQTAAWDSKPSSHSKSKKKSDKHSDYVADSYTECYPGGMEVAYDSDDEADYTKMDMGNKKGPIKRWDFENEEDYEAYMERREALPKAAFQFGIKMAEGRKTRRAGPKDDKAKLDRDWQRISRMLHKRKGDDRGEGSEGKKSKH